MSRRLTVVRAGPLTTVQDAGRAGHRADGVSPSGAADRGSMARANLLVGNPPGAAVLEATLGHLVALASESMAVAVTGAACPGVLNDEVVTLRPGTPLSLGAATSGLRAYVAVAGGIEVPAVLGSRSTDTLANLGPAPLRDGDRLPVGLPRGGGAAPGAVPGPVGSPALLRATRGPRDDWLDGEAWVALAARWWTVSPASDRVAVRLDGAPLRVRSGSLAPEPLVRGAVQLPPDGRPILFLADHPVTGGYPVVAVLDAASCDSLAQCRPGSRLRITVGSAQRSP